MVILPETTEVTFKGTLYHNTSLEDAQAILKTEFEVEDTSILTEAERGFVRGNLGDGVYLSPDYYENMNLWGGESNILVKPVRPLRLYNLGNEEGAAQVEEEFVLNIKKLGYDGIIVNDPHPRSGGYQVVVFNPSLIKAKSIVEHDATITLEQLNKIDLPFETFPTSKPPAVEIPVAEPGVPYTEAGFKVIGRTPSGANLLQTPEGHIIERIATGKQRGWWKVIIGKTEYVGKTPESAIEIAKSFGAIPEAMPEVKEPWQMTREEFRKEWESHSPKDPSVSQREYYKLIDTWRSSFIQRAIKDGKPVPTEVLVDYPELIKESNPGKEPWEMTEAEWSKSPQGMQAELTPLQWRLYKDDAKWIHLAHENLIHDALVEGKPVPPEVLKDYPDLGSHNPPSSPEIKVVPILGIKTNVPSMGAAIKELTERGYIKKVPPEPKTLEDALKLLPRETTFEENRIITISLMSPAGITRTQAREIERLTENLRKETVEAVINPMQRANEKVLSRFTELVPELDRLRMAQAEGNLNAKGLARLRELEGTPKPPAVEIPRRGFKQFTSAIKTAEGIVSQYPTEDIRVFGSLQTFKRAPLTERQARSLLSVTKARPDLDIVVHIPQVESFIKERENQIDFQEHDVRQYISGFPEGYDRLINIEGDTIFRAGDNYYKFTTAGLQWVDNPYLIQSLKWATPIKEVTESFYRQAFEPSPPAGMPEAASSISSLPRKMIAEEGYHSNPEEELPPNHEMLLHFGIEEVGSPGIVLDEAKARATPCNCFIYKSKPLCWSKGIVGLLTQDQQHLYCVAGKAYKAQPALTERYTRFAEAAEAAHKKIEAMPKGMPRLEAWLSAMGEELSKKGIEV